MFRDVFLITVDCLRPDYLGAYNALQRLTPHLDAVAGQGAVFTEAVAHAPFTTPAIGSLLTGAYPFRTGVRLLLGQVCDDRCASLAECARRVGYTTAGFPSTFILNSDTGLGRGFDVYRDIHDGVMTCRGGCWQTGDHLNGALDAFLGQAGRDPVFCWLHYFDLHDYHLDTSVPIQTSYPRDLRERIDGGCFAEFMGILDRHNRAEQASLIITADHGECLFQHGHRGHGQHLYDSVLRVPLIWRGGPVPGGSGYVGGQVRHVDIFPTLLDVWDVPREAWPTGLDGRSLRPRMERRKPSGTDDSRGEAGDSRGEAGGATGDDDGAAISYAEASPRQLFEGDIKARKAFAGPEQRALRTGRHKLILHDDGRRELFDLAVDPLEMHDLAGHDASMAGALADRLEAISASVDPAFAQVSYSPEEERKVIERLRALGYVS